MRTLSMLAVPKDDANSLMPVRELSLLRKLPYLGVRGLGGEMGLEKLAYRLVAVCAGRMSLAPSSTRTGGEGGRGRLGLFMAVLFSPRGRSGLSGMLTRVSTVVTLRVIAVKM
jgi:hypothetical protein